jgi:UDP-N-acetylmuramate--alanine ligase
MNIYFAGIGGVGIGPLAEIAIDAGYDLCGSDKEDSPLTRKLLNRGVDIEIGAQDGSFLKSQNAKNPIDLYVHTAAMTSDHPEFKAAQELDIKAVKRDQLLASIVKDHNLKLIAVSGTHGKTTVTGMLIWSLKQLGVPISYSIGTTLSFGPSGMFDKSSQYFVYECDEFDKNMLNFEPHLALITSLDYDHPDTYKDEKDYLTAFRQFAKQSQLTLSWSNQHADTFEDLPGVKILDDNDLNTDIKLAGEHNRRNASLVLSALETIGLSGGLTSALSSFPGTDRRFELLDDNLYSDYGHHPVEIAATLQMAREISDEVVLVYQPHQNIRQHDIKDQYTDQFELAEKIYWVPTYLSREDSKLSILEPKDLIQNLTNKDSVQIAELDQELWQLIQEARANGKLVVCMGAGTIDDWVRKMLVGSVNS